MWAVNSLIWVGLGNDILSSLEKVQLFAGERPLDLKAGFRLDPFVRISLDVFLRLSQADAMVLTAANAVTARPDRLVTFSVSTADKAAGVRNRYQ